jgi:hypothetical protein
VSTALLIMTVAVVVVGAAVFLTVRSRRRARQEKARRQYGPEYERTAKELGSEQEAEHDLRKRREKLERKVRPLSAESRERYDEKWQMVERTFLEDPGTALERADQVVAEVLEERNFPVDSRRDANESVGVMHPGVVEDFREAQRIHQESAGSRDEGASLPKMRQAIRKYRAVYDRLKKE